MSTTNTTAVKGKLFIQELVARLTGNSVEAEAAKRSRQAISALTGQISALTSKQITDEDNVDAATEKYNDALYPTTWVSPDAYCNGILSAKKALGIAQTQLDATTESIEFFQGLLTQFTSQDSDSETASA